MYRKCFIECIFKKLQCSDTIQRALWLEDLKCIHGLILMRKAQVGIDTLLCVNVEASGNKGDKDSGILIQAK